MVDVFISYRRSERTEVAAIAVALEAQGLSVWFDTHLEAGGDFQAEIDRVIRIAKSVLVVWTPEAYASGYVRAEALKGHERGVLVPALLKPTDLGPPFNLIQAQDLTRWNGQTQAPEWLSLVASIGRMVGRSDLHPSAPRTRGAGPAVAARAARTLRSATRIYAAAKPDAAKPFDYVAFGNSSDEVITLSAALWRRERIGSTIEERHLPGNGEPRLRLNVQHAIPVRLDGSRWCNGLWDLRRGDVFGPFQDGFDRCSVEPNLERIITYPEDKVSDAAWMYRVSDGRAVAKLETPNNTRPFCFIADRVFALSEAILHGPERIYEFRRAGSTLAPLGIFGGRRSGPTIVEKWTGRRVAEFPNASMLIWQELPDGVVAINPWQISFVSAEGQHQPHQLPSGTKIASAKVFSNNLCVLGTLDFKNGGSSACIFDFQGGSVLSKLPISDAWVFDHKSRFCISRQAVMAKWGLEQNKIVLTDLFAGAVAGTLATDQKPACFSEDGMRLLTWHGEVWALDWG